MTANLDDETETSLALLLVADGDDLTGPFDRAVADSRYDLHITRSRSVEDALIALEQFAFDVVVTDFWLGRETCLAIIEDPAVTERRQPVIILSNLNPEEIGQLTEISGPFASLSKSEITAARFDLVLSRLFNPEDHVDTICRPAVAGRLRPATAPAAGNLVAELGSVISVLDTVHANAAVASGALADGNVTDADALIRDAVNAAAHVRGALFDVLAGLRAADGGKTWLPQLADAVEAVDKGLRLVEFDAESKDIGLTFQRPDKDCVTECVADALQQMIEQLLAGVVWNAKPRSVVDVSVRRTNVIEIALVYTPSREIGLSRQTASAPALFDTLGALQAEAAKYGGSIEVEPCNDRLEAVLRLPALRPDTMTAVEMPVSQLPLTA